MAEPTSATPPAGTEPAKPADGAATNPAAAATNPAAAATNPAAAATNPAAAAPQTDDRPEEYPDPGIEEGGPQGPDPSRYGEWTLKGIAVDF